MKAEPFPAPLRTFEPLVLVSWTGILVELATKMRRRAMFERAWELGSFYVDAAGS
jgi:hypothetical protein